ncbi:MAG: hypothetical protein Q8S09_02965 [Hyphomonas sp.]|nr:hypothetical protein [Hyphomonas sp.]
MKQEMRSDALATSVGTLAGLPGPDRGAILRLLAAPVRRKVKAQLRLLRRMKRLGAEAAFGMSSKLSDQGISDRLIRHLALALNEEDWRLAQLSPSVAAFLRNWNGDTAGAPKSAAPPSAGPKRSPMPGDIRTSAANLSPAMNLFDRARAEGMPT